MNKRLQDYTFDKSQYERPMQDWNCGWTCDGRPCNLGPDRKGKCRAEYACIPFKKEDRWMCSRPKSHGGACNEGPLPNGACCRKLTPCQPVRNIRSKRAIAVKYFLAFSVAILLLMLGNKKSAPYHITPGDLINQHSAIAEKAKELREREEKKAEKAGTKAKHVTECMFCHSAARKGPIEWTHAAISSRAGVKESRLCLECHQQKEDAETLFRVDVGLQKSLDAGNVKDLQAAFKKKNVNISANATVATLEEGHRWLVQNEKEIAFYVRSSLDNENILNVSRDSMGLSVHGLSAEKLKIITDRVKKHSSSAPVMQLLANLLPGPADDKQKIACSTCHKEHHGRKHNLKILDNQQCQACHSVQFSSFSSGHPEYSDFPYNTRTNLKFNHIAHENIFKKLKKVAPTQCRDCHKLDDNGQLMRVKDYEITCAKCHSKTVGEQKFHRNYSMMAPEIQGLCNQCHQARVTTGPTYLDGTKMSALVDVVKKGNPSFSLSKWFSSIKKESMEYRATGHKDLLIKTLFDHSGKLYGTDANAKALFTSLQQTTGCTKCHSIIAKDDKSTQKINWSQRNTTNKGRFNKFSHAPHLTGMLGEKGCFKCHTFKEMPDPKNPKKKIAPENLFERAKFDAAFNSTKNTPYSNFSSIEKATCAQCHTADAAGDNCLLCHNYHVGEFAPALSSSAISLEASQLAKVVKDGASKTDNSAAESSRKASEAAESSRKASEAAESSRKASEAAESSRKASEAAESSRKASEAAAESSRQASLEASKQASIDAAKKSSSKPSSKPSSSKVAKSSSSKKSSKPKPKRETLSEAIKKLPKADQELFKLVKKEKAQKVDLTKINGPNACTMCHFAEPNSWKATRHFKAFKELANKPRAKKIAKRMGVKSIQNSKTCKQCHFTSQKRGGKTTAIAGISCESCHGPAKDWVNVHNQLGMPKKDRIAKSVAGGMLHPSNIYSVVQNCYQCHTIPNEDLVNKGGHPASPFELVEYFNGEIRHNFYSGKGKNRPWSQNQKRVMYVAGLMLDLEYSMRGVAKARKNSKGKSHKYLMRNNKYYKNMARRVIKAWNNLKKIAKKVKVPEVVKAIGLIKQFKLNTDPDLLTVYAKKFTVNHDGSKLKAVDAFIPKKTKGKAK